MDSACELVFVIDRSGSMAPYAEMAVAAYNKLLEGQKNSGPLKVTTVLFNNVLTVICKGEPVNDAKRMTSEVFCPNGGTAMLDAIGLTIKTVDGRKKKTDKVFFVVITDGEENASTIHSREMLADLMRSKEVEDWEFMYLVASNSEWTRKNCLTTASQLGFTTVWGLTSSEYEKGLEEIGKLVTSARASGVGGQFGIDLARSGYTRTMKAGRFTARLMKAPRLKSDEVCGLPPGCPIPVFPVDALPGCPADWVREQGSYVCPVSPEWGLWFDWSENDQMNTAVLPSVKGMNPITGHKIDNVELAKLSKECPVHKVPLASSGLCEKCGYILPPQNYIAYPNQPWWDGFRQSDGKVRQFFFTEEEERDVASAVIGKKNTVPAFGFAFFEPKKRREREMEREVKTCGMIGLNGSGIPNSYPFGYSSPLRSLQTPDLGSDPNTHDLGEVLIGSSSESADMCCFVADVEAPPAPIITKKARYGGPGGQSLGGAYVTTATVVKAYVAAAAAVKDVSVGAGSKIQQELVEDPMAVEDWKKNPSEVIRLYFVFKAQFEQIVKKGGIKNLEGAKEGFLKGVKVG